MLKLERKGFTRLEVVLGLCVTAAVLAVTLPSLWRGNGQDRQRNAMSRAEELASAVLDFRCDTGRWPESAGGELDVTCLTLTPAAAADQGFRAPHVDRDRPWLDEVPLDPWGRPYRVHLVGAAVAAAVVSDAAGYPSAPPAGIGILVISAGPDGVFQTDPRHGEAGFTGDDVGYSLVNPAVSGP